MNFFLYSMLVLPPVIGREFVDGKWVGTNGFAVLNGKSDTAFNEYYEIATGDDGHMEDYYKINKWGPDNKTLYDDLTPALWWTKNGGYNGSNICNEVKGKIKNFQFMKC